MTWPRDPNCPAPVTSCSVLGHIPTTNADGSRNCCICGEKA